jgi:hypothetical protein
VLEEYKPGYVQPDLQKKSVPSLGLSTQNDGTAWRQFQTVGKQPTLKRLAQTYHDRCGISMSA